MNINNQNGFTIVQAIFILVVLALLGTFMVRLSTVQQSTTTQALLQARAYQAARSGVEWGIATMVDPTSTSCFTDSTWQVGGYSVTTSCSSSVPYDEGDGNIYIYNIKAVATFGTIDSLEYVSRTVEVTIHDQ